MQLHPSLHRRIHLIWMCLCLVLVNPFIAQGAQPFDNCSGAILIPGAGPFPHLTSDLDVSQETTANDPPLPATQGFDTNITRSVWFKFTPQDGGLYTFSTGPDTGTRFADSTMALYTSPSGACGSFTLYAHNEDSGSLRASISTNLVAGTTYFIVVWAGRLSSPEFVGEEAVARESLELQLRISKPAIPANDTCANATVIPSNLTAAYLSPLIDTTLATTTANLAPPCVTNLGSIPSRDVWFRFTPAVSGSYILSTGSDTASILGNDGTLIDDTVIGIFTLPSGCGQAANQIACGDNGLGRAILSATLAAGTTYYIVVWDNSPTFVPGETALRLRVSPATKPHAETGPLLSISSTSAVLRTTVNANGLLSRFWFEWGSTTSLGSTSAVKILFAGAATFITNIAVSGFQPDQDYYYAVVATNSLGRATGVTNTFRWNSAPPGDLVFFPEATGVFQIEFTGSPFHNYIVQGSSNFLNWVDLGLATTNQIGGTDSAFLFRHVQAPPTAPHFFYRLKLP